jgi:hypothetical protein
MHRRLPMGRAMTALLSGLVPLLNARLGSTSSLKTRVRQATFVPIAQVGIISHSRLSEVVLVGDKVLPGVRYSVSPFRMVGPGRSSLPFYLMGICEGFFLLRRLGLAMGRPRNHGIKGVVAVRIRLQIRPCGGRGARKPRAGTPDNRSKKRPFGCSKLGLSPKSSG